VSSENGIRAFTLDNQIIDWLEKEGIYFEIQKDHVHLIEIEHPELEPASSSH
jgi:hypothetical protein